MLKRILAQCVQLVNRNAVTRKVIDGVEHVIISSATLPDDIVMNGGLYPAAEIESSYLTLERTLAPVEHPTDSAGNYISATDPSAIHNFYAGAYNTDVRRENGRVFVNKVINVQEALKSDRGRRLLDRVEELETSSNPRPIHTSVGVFVDVEELDAPQANAAGQEYQWVARNMVFDHDAILLDSVGAAQPHQGVGMAVNTDGNKIDVHRHYIQNTVKAAKALPLADSDRTWDSAAATQRVRAAVGAEDEPNAAYARYHLWYDADQSENFGAYKLPFVDIIDGEAHAIPAALRNAAARLSQTDGPSQSERAEIRDIIDAYLGKLQTNAVGMSYTQRQDAVRNALMGEPMHRGVEWLYVEDLYDDEVIYCADDVLYSVQYRLDGGRATLVSLPLPVSREITYKPRTNNQKGDAMREMMLKALQEAGIAVNAEITDAELLAKYNEHIAAQNSDDGQGSDEDSNGDVAAVVANALKPVVDQLAGLEQKLNQKDSEELDKLAELVGNSDKYPGLDVEAAKKLGVETLRSMAANCRSSFGLPLVDNHGDDDSFKSSEMPA